MSSIASFYIRNKLMLASLQFTDILFSIETELIHKEIIAVINMFEFKIRDILTKMHFICQVQK